MMCFFQHEKSIPTWEFLFYIFLIIKLLLPKNKLNSCNCKLQIDNVMQKKKKCKYNDRMNKN